MTSYLKYLGLIAALLGISGCSTDEEVSKIQTEPISLLRIKDGTDEIEAPRNIQIRPEQKEVSVFYTFDENYENHELSAYDVTDETIDISYDDRILSLTDIDNRQYEDDEGNIYQLEFYTENYEDE